MSLEVKAVAQALPRSFSVSMWMCPANLISAAKQAYGCTDNEISG